MKNIHVLPTDKPSRLVKQKYDTIDRFCLADIATKRAEYKRFNIYITSDEFIEEVDFGLHLSTKKIVQYDGIKGLDSYYKKIILTTDQDLIKDGVQAIDDEFLEWFVNNPSWESFEVIDNLKYFNVDELRERHIKKLPYLYSEIIGYKIITPKEEQTKCYCGHTTYCDCGLEEPKQETLEEVAEKYVDSFVYGIAHLRIVCKNAFINGAKWQQERSYSEEEFLEFSQWVSHNDWVYLPSKVYWVNEEQEELDQKITTKELFEQFNNK